MTYHSAYRAPLQRESYHNATSSHAKLYGIWPKKNREIMEREEMWMEEKIKQTARKNRNQLLIGVSNSSVQF